MSNLRLSLEGKNANSAAEKLFMDTGLQGDWETQSDVPTKDGGILAAVGTVVGIVGGTVTVADQVRKWYLEHKKTDKKLNVVLVIDDVRLVLEGASANDIRNVLEELQG